MRNNGPMGSSPARRIDRIPPAVARTRKPKGVVMTRQEQRVVPRKRAARRLVDRPQEEGLERGRFRTTEVGLEESVDTEHGIVPPRGREDEKKGDGENDPPARTMIPRRSR